MIKATNLKVAHAHLTSRIKQGLVATLSVTFGISMYIFMNGFMTGVNDIQGELAFSTLAHVHIYNDLPEMSVQARLWHARFDPGSSAYGATSSQQESLRRIC